MNEALKRAQAAYSKKCKFVQLRFNTETETELIEWLNRGNTATRIKKLIRKDLEKNPVT